MEISVEEIEKQQSAKTIEQIEQERAQSEQQSPEGAPNSEASGSHDSAGQAIRDKLKKQDGFWNRIAPDRNKEAKADDPKGDDGTQSANAEQKQAEQTAAPPERKAARRTRKEAPAVDPLKIAEVQAREIGKTIAESLKGQQPTATERAAEPSEEDILKNLPEEFRKHAETFAEMKARNPNKYGGLIKELGTYAAREQDYKRQWEADHPGQKFDADDPEHNDFYDSIAPQYDEDDFEAAREEVLLRRAEERVHKRFEPKLQEIEREKKLAAIAPVMQEETLGFVSSVLEQIDQENVKLAESLESVQKLSDVNPIAADALATAAERFLPLIQTNIRLFRGAEAFNAKNPAHAAIADVITSAERDVLALPVADRVSEDGRLFATQADYMKMSPEQKAKHWFIGEQEVNYLIRGQAAAAAKKQYDYENKKVQKVIERRGLANPNASNSAQSKPPGAGSSAAAINAPSITGRATVGHDAKGGSSTPQSGKDLFWSRYTRQ